ncbi:MAG: MtrB/PioB family decaheme-associated outer membrane protein [Pseudomonadota bacterium]
MKTSKHIVRLRHSVMALAILGAFAPAFAADPALAEYLKPSSTASVGFGANSGDSAERAIFGQYSGLRDKRGELLLDLEYLSRDDASGTWTSARVLNPTLGTRELGAAYERQGDWKASVGYSELERVYPRDLNTGLVGIGTPTPTVVRIPTPGSGADVELKTSRKASSLGFEKWFGPSLQLETSFKNEEKTGARLWGRGYDCAAYVCGQSTTTAINQAAFVKNALLLLPEPINSSTQQLDARLNYRDEKLLLSLGYYGSLYNNAFGNMTATVPNSFNNGLGAAFPGYPAVTGAIIPGGGMSLQNVLQTPMALPPDNQAHQIFVDGNYAVAPKTKLNFKYAYTYATQRDNFAANGLTDAPAGVTSLNAKVVSTLYQVGLTARPLDKLSVLVNARHEKKDDQTPTAQYNLEPIAVVPATNPVSYTTNGAYWDNNNTSSTRNAAKIEASYRLPADLRATIGADYSSLEREVPNSIAEEKVAGLNALRAKNTDKGYRVELRRSLSDTLNGAVSYSRSKRGGSDWTSLSQLNPATPGISATNLALINLYCGGKACYGQEIPASSVIGLSATNPFILTQTDLERRKWKLATDWNPTERFGVQLVVENGKDKNTSPINEVAGGKGWRDAKIALYSLDAAYVLTENWRLGAYASHADQTQQINHSTGYMASLNNINDAAGLTLSGKATSQIELGATVSYLKDVNHYGIEAASGTAGTLPGPLTVVAPSAANLAQAAVGLPDVSFRQLGVKLFGTYALKKNANLRLDIGHQRVKFDEWQWSNNGVPFIYADNTSVTMKADQVVNYIALNYICKF